MKNKNYDELDNLIRASMDIDDKPSLELNTNLKASLYQHEVVLQHQIPTREVSLWYFPMILNFITFALLAAMSWLMIANPYLSKFIAAICLYMGVAIYNPLSGASFGGQSTPRMEKYEYKSVWIGDIRSHHSPTMEKTGYAAFSREKLAQKFLIR